MIDFRFLEGVQCSDGAWEESYDSISASVCVCLVFFAESLGMLFYLVSLVDVVWVAEAPSNSIVIAVGIEALSMSSRA